MDFKRKAMGIPVWLIVLVLIAGFCTVGYAVLPVVIRILNIPSSVTVVSSPGLELIASDGTTVVTSISFGSVSQGATETWSGYLKNAGTEDLYSFLISSPDLGSVGTVTWNITAMTHLAPNATYPVTISLTIAQMANPGIYPFTIQITASPTYITSVVIQASDPNDPYLRYWAVTFDRPMPPKNPDGYVGADVNEVHRSGDTMTVRWALSAGPHYLLFIVSQSGGPSYGTYSGTIIINGQTYNFSGVDQTVPAMINFTIVYPP